MSSNKTIGEPPKPIDWSAPTTNQKLLSGLIEYARIPPDSFFIWPPFPDQYHSIFGGLMLSWAMLDKEFNILLAWLSTQFPNQEDIKTVAGDNFKRKLELLKSLLKTRFDGEPNILQYLNTLASEIKEAQGKRNILVHGRLFLRVSKAENGDITHALTTTGRYKGSKQTIEFDLNDLEDLRYGICSIAGSVKAALKGKFPPGTNSDEVLRVQKYLLTTPPLREPPPGPTPQEAGVNLEVRPVNVDQHTGIVRDAPIHPQSRKIDLKF